MVNYTILAGGYTSAVATYLFNSDAGSLSLLSQSTTGMNPSWIELHPTNKSILYAVNEVDDGALQSFAIDSNGALSAPAATVSSGGNGPAFLAPLSTGDVAIMNFGGGNGRIIPESSDPLQFDDASGVLVTFPAPVSNPHMALEFGSEIFVSDFGADKIWRLDASAPYDIHGFIEQPAGSGPRHMAVLNDTLYTIHETASTLTAQTIAPGPNGTSTIDTDVSVVPSDAPANGSYFAGEVLLAPPTDASAGVAAYIYASNRNLAGNDPRGDSVAIFAVDAAAPTKPTLVAQAFTGISQIRGMQLSPDGRFLVASGVVGTAGVKVFERTSGGADLQEVAANTDLPTRTAFVWMENAADVAASASSAAASSSSTAVSGLKAAALSGAGRVQVGLGAVVVLGVSVMSFIQV